MVAPSRWVKEQGGCCLTSTRHLLGLEVSTQACLEQEVVQELALAAATSAPAMQHHCLQWVPCHPTHDVLPLLMLLHN